MVQKFAIGQRWISEPEPELGLGIITFCDNRFVEINFPSQKIKRKYSAASAPLKRIILTPVIPFRIPKVQNLLLQI
ncbi:MAG: hypothetical protein GX640_20360 [Fibrobacter sp.]|nr:hypothetical protein [Fibrobacter sp.]